MTRRWRGAGNCGTFETPSSRRTLRVETLEPRCCLSGTSSGVTVVTHGFQANGVFPDWVVAMGQAILDRADGDRTDRSVGSLLRHNPASGNWDPLPQTVWNNSYAFDEPIVLLYDWADESNDLDDGWLEAAADNLFASLVGENDLLPGELAGRSFLEVASAAGGGGGLLNMHWIGHSRGAVLNSRAVARFDVHFDLAVDQVTSLDPHPASFMNDPGYSAVDPNVRSRLFTYDNVLFADNYYRQDGAYEPFNFDFNGVAADGAYNVRIPESTLAVGGSSLEHSDVHTWYYGTVTEPLPPNYAGFGGAQRDNDGDVAIPAAWYGVGETPARHATGYALSRVGGADRTGLRTDGDPIDAGAAVSAFGGAVFNGDFSWGNSLFDDEIPGWERHGGGGTGNLAGADPYVELNAGGEDFERRHNRLFFPLHATAVQYDYWISDNDVFSPNDALQVLVGDQAIDLILLAEETTGFVRNRIAELPPSHNGFVAELTFRILDAGGDGIDSAVRIDNVRLQVVAPPSNPDLNADGAVDGGDFLAWQRAFHAYDGNGVTPADGDADGDVDGRDLGLWAHAWGGAGSLTSIAGSGAYASADGQAANLIEGRSERAIDGGRRRIFGPRERLRLS